MERKALGKGISALIPEQGLGRGERIMYLPIEQVRPNPFQPREDFDQQSLEELTQSIKEKGILQPVLVRRQGEYYELIAGERRFRAANLLGIKEIPVIIKDAQDIDSLEISLIENIQRQDLNPIEEAHAFAYLIDKFQLTQERVSEILGKARVTVTNILRLLKLPLEVQDEIKNGRISYAHGRVLLEVEDPNRQRRLAQEIISNSLSVRELENLIRARGHKVSRSKMTASARDPYVAVLEEELQQVLATKVRITRRKKRGHITIEFFSDADLKRIVAKMRGED